VYDLQSMEPLARRAGVGDVRAFSRRFWPTLAAPAVLACFNALAGLVLLLALLRLPHAVLWYMAKERRRRVREELPLFVSSLAWLIGVYPVPKALCLAGSGELARLFRGFCDRYSRGESFESALGSCAVFPEIEERAKRLMVDYRTGGGLDILQLYADRIASENLSGVKTSAARMQVFAVAYTALVAVLPAMYSGLALYSAPGNVFPLSMAAGALLVVSWKVLE
jgi:Flp pilus assembly protein TadB